MSKVIVDYRENCFGKKNLNKKRVLIFAVLILIVVLSFFATGNVSAASTDNSETVNKLTEIINEQLGSLNFDDIQKILDSLSDQQKSIFGSKNFLDKLGDILSGKQGVDFSSVLGCIFSLFADDVLGIVPILSIICAIAILSGLLSQTRPKTLNKPLGDLVHFVCFGFIVIIIFTSMADLVTLVKTTLTSLETQTEIAFPILLTLMTALGANVSVGVYQPAVAVLSGLILTICTGVLLPIFVFSMILSVAGNISGNIKLTNFSNFFSSGFKWITGLVFTIFSAFLSIQGITAGSYDGISIRATKYAIKSYVPILGSYLSDGFSIIMASSALIKNAVGFCGLLLLFSTIITPLIKILVFKFGIMLVSAVTEPIVDKRTSDFLGSVAKNMNMLVAVLLTFSFSYFLTVGLIMCTSNVF